MVEKQVTRREFIQDTTVAVAGTALGTSLALQPGIAAAASDPRRTRSYNPDMEYRRLGRTGLMLSAVSMGGHWKQIPYANGSDDFKKNRREVISVALDHGINYIDACCAGEVMAYAEALGDKREKIYFGFDWTGGREPEVASSLPRMKQDLDEGLKKAKLDYVDIWRVTLREQATLNTDKELDTIAAALEWGKKTGKARCTGVSTHHRPWIAQAVSRYPQLEVIISPYSAGSQRRPVGSMFEALKAHDVGFIGIKPFAGGTVFKSGGAPDSATRKEDDDRARMVLRYVLCCDVLTAAIPGLITVNQVKNAAAAVKERRKFDVAEAAIYRELTDEMWTKLPQGYGWLRDWHYV